MELLTLVGIVLISIPLIFLIIFLAKELFELIIETFLEQPGFMTLILMAVVGLFILISVSVP